MQPKTIGDRIRALRIKKNLSVGSMAIQLGVERKVLYRWEAGENKPDIDNVALLSMFFNVTTDYLIMGK